MVYHLREARDPHPGYADSGGPRQPGPRSKAAQQKKQEEQEVKKKAKTKGMKELAKLENSKAQELETERTPPVVKTQARRTRAQTKAEASALPPAPSSPSPAVESGDLPMDLDNNQDSDAPMSIEDDSGSMELVDDSENGQMDVDSGDEDHAEPAAMGSSSEDEQDELNLDGDTADAAVPSEAASDFGEDIVVDKKPGSARAAINEYRRRKPAPKKDEVQVVPSSDPNERSAEVPETPRQQAMVKRKRAAMADSSDDEAYQGAKRRVEDNDDHPEEDQFIEDSPMVQPLSKTSQKAKVANNAPTGKNFESLFDSDVEVVDHVPRKTAEEHRASRKENESEDAQGPKGKQTKDKGKGRAAGEQDNRKGKPRSHHDKNNEANADVRPPVKPRYEDKGKTVKHQKQASTSASQSAHGRQDTDPNGEDRLDGNNSHSYHPERPGSSIAKWANNVTKGSKPSSSRTLSTNSRVPSLTHSKASSAQSSSLKSSRSAFSNNVGIRDARNDDDDEIQFIGGLSDYDETMGEEHAERQRTPKKAGQRVTSKALVKVEEEDVKPLVKKGRDSNRKNGKLPQSVFEGEKWARVVRTMIEWMSCQVSPWHMPEEDYTHNLQTICDSICKPPGTIVVDSMKCPASQVMQQRLTDKWRSIIGSAAFTIVNSYYASDTDFDTDLARQDFARYMLDRNRFLYARNHSKDNNKWKGIFRAPFIIHLFAVHLKRAAGAAQVDKLTYGPGGNQPRAALALCATALKRAFSMWADGSFSVARLQNAEADKKKKLTIKDTLRPLPSQTTGTENTSYARFSCHRWSSTTDKYYHSASTQLDDAAMEEIKEAAKAVKVVIDSKTSPHDEGADDDDEEIVEGTATTDEEDYESDNGRGGWVKPGHLNAVASKADGHRQASSGVPPSKDRGGHHHSSKSAPASQNNDMRTTSQTGQDGGRSRKHHEQPDHRQRKAEQQHHNGASRSRDPPPSSREHREDRDQQQTNKHHHRGPSLHGRDHSSHSQEHREHQQQSKHRQRMASPHGRDRSPRRSNTGRDQSPGPRDASYHRHDPRDRSASPRQRQVQPRRDYSSHHQDRSPPPQHRRPRVEVLSPRQDHHQAQAQPLSSSPLPPLYGDNDYDYTVQASGRESRSHSGWDDD